jgi:hypothetical protein
VIVPDRVRLPLSFDAPALAAEALALGHEDWVPHFNRDIYEGEWGGVALRSVGGVATQLYPDPAAQAPFADTERLDRCPGHRRALAQFRCHRIHLVIDCVVDDWLRELMSAAIQNG